MVIGYGNDLRRDDGAGRHVADAIEAEAIDGVRVRSVSQLTPELAVDIAGADCVVFVDASVDHEVVEIAQVRTGRFGAPSAMSHHGEPATMLGLVATIGPVPRIAYTVSIPALDLGLGFGLSPLTAQGVRTATNEIRRLIAEHSG